MSIELIVIGNELLRGAIKDLNGPWLGSFLQGHGNSLSRINTLADQVDLIAKEIKLASQRSKFIILSGGIGPTQDDLTKMALAKYLNSDLVDSEQAFKVAKQNYSRFNKQFDPASNNYNKIPEGSIAFDNPKGLAPGIEASIAGVHIFLLPGVPREFQAMFETITWPKIEKNLGQKENCFFLNFRTMLFPEEKIFTQLAPKLWSELSSLGSVSSLPQILGIDIGVLLKEKNMALLEEKKQRAIEIIHKSAIKNFLWQIGNKSIEEVVIQLATQKNMTISTAESCTGGLVSSRLTDVPGSSKVFLGGIVSYSNQAKQDLLNVNSNIINQYGAVSEQTALQMATNVRLQFNSDLSVSLSGIAGPGGGSPQKPVGTLCMGISGKKIEMAKTFHKVGDRKMLKQYFSQLALYELYTQLNS